jgi:hypothetical protein
MEKNLVGNTAFHQNLFLPQHNKIIFYLNEVRKHTLGPMQQHVVMLHLEYGNPLMGLMDLSARLYSVAALLLINYKIN